MPKAKSAGPITPTIPNPVNVRMSTRNAGLAAAVAPVLITVLKKRYSATGMTRNGSAKAGVLRCRSVSNRASAT